MIRLKKAIWAKDLIIGKKIATIPSFPNYIASSDGMIFCRRKLKLYPQQKYKDLEKISIVKQRDGRYLTVSLFKNGKKFQQTVHKLVLEAFIGPKPIGFEACHFDGNKHNNDIGNLRWASKVDNREDDYHNGSKFRKLNKILAEQIREYKGKGISSHIICKQFGCSSAMIRQVWRGARWKK